jgi:hypothetical protein
MVRVEVRDGRSTISCGVMLMTEMVLDAVEIVLMLRESPAPFYVTVPLPIRADDGDDDRALADVGTGA